MPSTVIITIAGYAITAGMVATWVIGSIVSMLISAAFTRKPDASSNYSSALNDQARTLSGVESAAEWEVVYGQVRKGGKYVFRAVSDANVSQLVEEYVVPTTAPYTVYLERGADTISITQVHKVTPPADPDSSETYTSITSTGGTPGETEFSHSSGVLTFNAAQAGKNMRVIYTAAGTAASGGSYLHLVLVLAAHQCEAIDTIYFNDEEVTLDGSGYATGKYAGHVYVEKYLGTTTQTASAALIAEVPDQWTSAHRGRGHCYIYVRLLRNPNLFPSGVPNISALMRGRNEIYDPRDASTGYSTNAALCIADYLTHEVWGLGAVYADEINETQLIAAANVCDENVTLAAGGTEDRYTLNGVINTAQTPEDIIGKMLTACAGRVVYVGGEWFIHPASYVAPTLSFDEGDLRGPIKVTSLLSARDKFNAVKGVYVSPDNNWQPSDFPPVTSSTYETEDGGERVWRELDMPFTISAATAQRIAKIELLRVRQQITSVMPFNMAAYRAQPPNVVQINNTRFGWSSKEFEVTESKIQFGEEMGVDLSLRETSEDIYDWSTSEETAIDSAPNTTLGNPFYIAAPGAPSATETIYQSFGSGVRAKAVVTWTGSTDAQAVRYELQWQVRGQTAWNSQAGITGLSAEIPEITNAEYLIRVRAYNNLGVQGAWAQSQVTFTGLSAPPAAVTWFVIDGDTLAWQAPNDLDVSGYRLRFHYGLNTSWGDANSLHGGLITESPFQLVPRPAGQVTLMIKPVDALGNESVTAAYIVTDLGDADVANVVETIDLAALSWPGTLTDGTETGGELLADDASGLAWDANENTAGWTYDSAAGWDADVYHQMTYLAEVWPTEAGAGSVMTLAHDITATAYSIEYRRQAPASAWTLDSEAGWTTDADPGWSTPESWQPWPGSVVVLNEPYDVRVITAQSGTQGTITDLVFTIDMPDITEHFEDVVIASGGTRLPITQTYRAIKAVSVTVQSDGNNGIGERVIDKSAALGPQIKVYDAAGTAVTGLIDATIRGY